MQCTRCTRVEAVLVSWRSVRPLTPWNAGCRMGGSKRYPSFPQPTAMGIASLHPSYVCVLFARAFIINDNPAINEITPPAKMNGALT